jgi:hypothetical protein
MLMRSRGKGKAPAKDGANPKVPVIDKTATPETPEKKEAPAADKPAASKGVVADPTQSMFESDTTFLTPTQPGYVATPTGRQVLTGKHRTMSQNDVAFRLQAWAFDCKGYFEYGTQTLMKPPNDLKSQENVYRDYYQLARGVIARTQTNDTLLLDSGCLADNNTMRYYLNACFTDVANTGMLINLNRCSVLGTAWSGISRVLPRYMSRINRNWRRLSSIIMTPNVRAHAIRSANIFYAPGVLAHTIRVWKGNYLKRESEGGPPELAIAPANPEVVAPLYEVLTNEVELAQFVSWLEDLTHWLLFGDTPTPTDDQLALKDLLGMAATNKVLAGSWVTGLPRSNDLPGQIVDASLINEVLSRAVFLKDDVSAGTDQWFMFPVVGNTTLQRRVPVMGLGMPSLYDSISMGAPKFGQLGENEDQIKADVDVAMWCNGTEHQVHNDLSFQTEDIRAHFGLKPFTAQGREYGNESVHYKNGSGNEAYGKVVNDGAFGTLLSEPTVLAQHVLMHAILRLEEAGTMDDIMGLFEEADVSWLWYINPEDEGFDTAALATNMLKIPDLFDGVCQLAWTVKPEGGG